MRSFGKVQSWRVRYLSLQKGEKPVHYKLVNAINVWGAMNKAIKILPGDALIVSIALEFEPRG